MKKVQLNHSDYQDSSHLFIQVVVHPPHLLPAIKKLWTRYADTQMNSYPPNPTDIETTDKQIQRLFVVPSVYVSFFAAFPVTEHYRSVMQSARTQKDTDASC